MILQPLELLYDLITVYLKLLVLVIFLNVVFPFLPNSKSRYYGSYLIYILTASTLTVLYIPLLCLRPRSPYNVLWTYPAAKCTTEILGIRWELRGEHNLKEVKGAVVCLNHQSLFDSLGLILMSPVVRKLRNVARKEVFYYWPFGLGAWLGGTLFIDRHNGRAAYKVLDQVAKSLKTDEIKLVMFPEGTRNRKGEKLLPFKRGAFRIAIEAKVPIVPVVYSPYYFIDSKKKLFDRGHIIMQALTPIPTDKMTAQDVDELMQKTKDVMETEYQLLAKEVRCNTNKSG